MSCIIPPLIWSVRDGVARAICCRCVEHYRSNLYKAALVPIRTPERLFGNQVQPTFCVKSFFGSTPFLHHP
uniref:ARAD1D12606p n=1 Tax=Blastobotrys adeninivorans TaxID=409370 RepID=A0A060T8M3_BLAAD